MKLNSRASHTQSHSELRSPEAPAPPTESREIGPGLTATYAGTQTYASGLELQEHAILEALAHPDSIGTVLGLEHRTVITLGKRSVTEDDLHISRETLRKRDIDLVVSSRGGQATLHSPGQLVIYPCVKLAALKVGVRDYVKGLETATQTFLQSLGVTTHSGCCGEPGLYTDLGKVAFFGIRVSKGIATHGLSINVANDLELFQMIRSCGVSNEKFDRLANHGIRSDSKELFFSWIPHFLKAFA